MNAVDIIVRIAAWFAVIIGPLALLVSVYWAGRRGATDKRGNSLSGSFIGATLYIILAGRVLGWW